MKKKSDLSLKDSIFEVLGERLFGRQFILNASKDEFVRKGDGVVDQFQLVCKNARPGFRIQPNVGVRIDCVEDIFHQSSEFEARFQGGTSTVGTAVGTLLTGSPRGCEFVLESMSEIASVAEKIMVVFQEIALPYFEHWHSLQAIDGELNSDPAKPTLHRSLAWFRCSTGIIVARLVGRSDFEQLRAHYLNVMTQDNRGFYLKQFQSLLGSLDSVTPGRL